MVAEAVQAVEVMLYLWRDCQVGEVRGWWLRLYKLCRLCCTCGGIIRYGRLEDGG